MSIKSRTANSLKELNIQCEKKILILREFLKCSSQKKMLIMYETEKYFSTFNLKLFFLFEKKKKLWNVMYVVTNAI